MNRRLYQIREFAKRSGVTVRTLHHYDRLGLLKPTSVSESGYRLYSDADFGRLQQIVTLKFIGFSLRQIRDLFDGEELDLATTLRLQRSAMLARRTQLDIAIQAIEAAERIVLSGGDPEPESFTQIIEAITMESNNEMFKRYYTEEQMAEFERRSAADPDLVRKGTEDWMQLIREVEGSLDEDPAGEHAQSLAARWLDLVRQFTQGDPEIERRLKNFYSDEANWPSTFKKPYSDEVEAFINKAMEARKRMGSNE